MVFLTRPSPAPRKSMLTYGMANSAARRNGINCFDEVRMRAIIRFDTRAPTTPEPLLLPFDAGDVLPSDHRVEALSRRSAGRRMPNICDFVGCGLVRLSPGDQETRVARTLLSSFGK
jgi:hypothetical protein